MNQRTDRLICENVLGITKSIEKRFFKMDLVLWSACVRKYALPQHIEAAVAGGFTSLAITPETFMASIASGLSPEKMLDIANKNGIAIRYLDTVTGWSPVRVPLNADDEIRKRFDFTMEECLDICDRLKLKSILAFPGFDAGAVSVPALISGFGELCDRAAARDIWVDLEFTPLSGLPDLKSAWTIVQESGRKNCGIMLDTYHFLRGSVDLDLLRTIPSERLVNIQVADASREMLGATLLEDCMHYRMPPGEGDLPLVQILNRVCAKGHLNSIGPEIFSDEMDLLLPAEAGRKAGESTRKLLQMAGCH